MLNGSVYERAWQVIEWMLSQKHDNLFFFYPYNKLKVDLKVKSDEQQNYKSVPV